MLARYAIFALVAFGFVDATLKNQAVVQCATPSGKIQTSVAAGHALAVVATGLSRPRGLAVDNSGRLLVVQAGTGAITAHTISEANGCISASAGTTVVPGMGLNHGIALDNNFLYASTTNEAYAWPYNHATGQIGQKQTIVTGMAGTDHSTRTLELSKKIPGMLIIGRGSLANLDPNATTIAGGTAQIRVFNLNTRNGATYRWADGRLLAWGVRNEVGLAEEPTTGIVYGVENSADQIVRYNVDVSNNNPGEELNSFGTLSDTSARNIYYGYPYCLAAWGVQDLPRNQGLQVGSQFAFNAAPELNNKNQTDAWCKQNTVSPRLTFQAHQAPLDIKFWKTGSEAWVTFHGSWDRQQPVGYRVSRIFFQNGQPVQPSTSTTAEVVMVSNKDNSKCPNDCFRPVAMAWDSKGRLFFSSDSSGEIYQIRPI